MPQPQQHTQLNFILENHGIIILLRPITDAAREWVDEHIGEDNAYQGLWPAVTIEPRYLQPIIDGIRQDGMSI